MAVKIGSARIDEHGHIRGGALGDNNSKEVAVENWYLPSQGYWRVFCPKDPAVAEKIAWDMEAACRNDRIGYDQSNNQSLWHIVQGLGYDCAKVTTPCETDCSQLVRVCIWYAGIEIGMFSTADEPQYLLGTGQFVELTGDKYQKSSDYLTRGCLLVTPRKGHTVCVLSDGAKAKNVLEEDGWWGANTTKYTAKMLGCDAATEMVKQYRPNKKFFPNATGGWQWKLVGWKGGSPVMQAIQKHIGTDADGIGGKKTVMKMQTFLMNKGYTISSAELSKPTMGATTVKGWQKYVNSYFKK